MTGMPSLEPQAIADLVLDGTTHKLFCFCLRRYSVWGNAYKDDEKEVFFL